MSNRIAIVGSRKFSSEEAVRSYVRRLPLDTVIVSGGAKGPDSWAESEALRRGMKTLAFVPMEFFGAVRILERRDGEAKAMEGGKAYSSYGQAAYARNAMIVEHADAVIAFWDGESKGTMNTVDLAHKAKLPFAVLTVDANGSLHGTSTELAANLWIVPREGH